MIARAGRRRPRGRTLAGALLAGAGVLAAAPACTGDTAPLPPADTATTPAASTPPTSRGAAPPTSRGAAPPTSTNEVPAVDCSSVEAAQEELDEAFATELERLGVHRGDPRAQSVYALVTTSEGPRYYAAVLAAAPPQLSGDAALVLDYFQRLATRAGDLDAGSGSPEDLTAAMSALDDAAAAVADPAAGTAAVDAQERLRAALERACSGPATSPGPTGPSSGPPGSATGTTPASSPPR